jgi:hypothetical protein
MTFIKADYNTESENVTAVDTREGPKSRPGAFDTPFTAERAASGGGASAVSAFTRVGWAPDAKEGDIFVNTASGLGWVHDGTVWQPLKYDWHPVVGKDPEIWDGTLAYQVGDVVTQDTKAFICAKAVPAGSGVPHVNSFWRRIDLEYRELTTQAILGGRQHTTTMTGVDPVDDAPLDPVMGDIHVNTATADSFSYFEQQGWVLVQHHLGARVGAGAPVDDQFWIIGVSDTGGETPATRSATSPWLTFSDQEQFWNSVDTQLWTYHQATSSWVASAPGVASVAPVLPPAGTPVLTTIPGTPNVPGPVFYLDSAAGQFYFKAKDSDTWEPHAYDIEQYVVPRIPAMHDDFLQPTLKQVEDATVPDGVRWEWKWQPNPFFGGKHETITGHVALATSDFIAGKGSIAGEITIGAGWMVFDSLDGMIYYTPVEIDVDSVGYGTPWPNDVVLQPSKGDEPLGNAGAHKLGSWMPVNASSLAFAADRAAAFVNSLTGNWADWRGSLRARDRAAVDLGKANGRFIAGEIVIDRTTPFVPGLAVTTPIFMAAESVSTSVNPNGDTTGAWKEVDFRDMVQWSVPTVVSNKQPGMDQYAPWKETLIGKANVSAVTVRAAAGMPAALTAPGTTLTFSALSPVSWADIEAFSKMPGDTEMAVLSAVTPTAPKRPDGSAAQIGDLVAFFGTDPVGFWPFGYNAGPPQPYQPMPGAVWIKPIGLKGQAAPGDGFGAEATITGQDAANAAKLAALGYVAVKTAAWTANECIVIGEPGFGFHWTGAAWAAGLA